MALPRFRFRLRGLMVAVAIIGSLLGGGVALERRRLRFEQLARDHGGGLSQYGYGAGSAVLHEDATCVEFQQKEYPPSPDGHHIHPLSGLMTKHDRLWSAYHDGMLKKYELAARRPWLPVAPDLPPPPGPDRHDAPYR